MPSMGLKGVYGGQRSALQVLFVGRKNMLGGDWLLNVPNSSQNAFKATFELSDDQPESGVGRQLSLS